MLLLRWLGVTERAKTDAIEGSAFFKLLSGLITLIGLLSSIMGIILDWRDLLELLA